MNFVLRLSGFQSLSKRSPKTIQAGIRHFQHSAGIAELSAVQKEVRFRRVGIAICIALEHSERNQGIKKIARAAGMQPQPLRQLFPGKRTCGKFREYSEFNRTE